MLYIFSMPKFTFHAFAHPCITEKGHQFNYHRSWQEAIESLGIPYFAYIPKNHTLPFLPHNWIGHFPPPYDKSQKRSYLLACDTLFGATSQEPRIFFIETLMRRDLRYRARLEPTEALREG